MHLYEGLHEACQQKALRGVFLCNSICPFWNIHQPQAGAELCCWNKEIANSLLEYLRNHPELQTIVISLRWEFRFRATQASQWPEAIGSDWRTGIQFDDEQERMAVAGPGLGEFCDHVRALNKKVVLLGCTPVFPMSPLDEWERCQKFKLPYQERTISTTRHEQTNAFSYGVLRSLDKEGRAHLIDTAPPLQSEGTYPARIDGQFLYVDGAHLSEVGERRVINYIMPRLVEIFNQAGK